MSADPVSAADVATELVLYAACLPGVPFRNYVDAASQAGFDAVTIWPLMYRRALSREGLSPQSIVSVVEDAGLKLLDLDPIGVWLPDSGAGADEPATFRSVWERRQFFDVAEALGIESLVAVSLGADRVEPEVAIEGFADLCDDAAEHGLTVGLEFMPFSGIPDLESALRIVRGADRPNGGLVFDLWHLHRSGGDRSLFDQLDPELVFCVQLSDGPSTAEADLREEAMWSRRPPGDGSFDLAGDLLALAERGVRTRVGPELYLRGFSEREPLTVARELMAATRRVLGTDS